MKVDIPLDVMHTKAFKKDLKRCKKRNKDCNKILTIIENLRHRKKLSSKHDVHPLSDYYHRHLECHIEPDWLLIWKVEGNELCLQRTGSHADLFG